MTNYEKIKFLLEMGVYKGVEVNANGMMYLFVAIAIDGLSILTWLGEEMGQRDIKGLDITSITPIPNPPKLLPVGTKVRVFEEFRETGSEIVEIVGYSDKFHAYDLDCGSFGLRVPARAVYPVFDV